MSKTAFIFPGQGSQFVGMGQDVYEQYPEARAVFDTASKAVGFDLKKLCFHDPEDKLKLTTYTQPAILTASLAFWMCMGNPEKAFLAGHSLGELTALAVGGAIDIGTAVSMVMERGRFMQEAVPADLGAMAAIIGLDHQDIEEICKSAWEVGRVWPANFNCPGQIVISGEKKGIQKAMVLAKEKGARHTIMLPVSIPSHCPLMEPAAQRMSEWLNPIDLNHSEVPIVSNCWAVPIKEKNPLKKNIIEQLISPVRWEEGIQFMLQEGVTRFVEVGPGKVLTGLIRRIDKQSEIINISDVEGLERFKEAVQ